MHVTSTLKLALQSILTNKGRSFLTMLGVIIGVSAVILLVSIGSGLQQYITGQFEDLGSNTLYVVPGNPFGEGGGFNQESSFAAVANNSFGMQDVARIGRLRGLVKGVSPMSMNQAEVSYRSTTDRLTILGVNSSFAKLSNSEPEIGTFFTQADNEKRSRVAVLGSQVVDELFGDIDPIGKPITIGSQEYRVTGVIPEKGGSFGGPSFDSYVYIPIETFFQVFNTDTVMEIYVQAQSSEQIDEAREAIEAIFLERLDEEEFSVFDQREILDTINQILGVLTAGLGGIAAISLVVGGIGIMNIMLVSVTERTREVGLRKALGATPKVILQQFLIEATTLSVIGGLIGVLIATLGSLAINQFFPAVVTPGAVLLAFLVSVIIGIVFGVYPARKAAKLSPIEALRYE